MVAVLDKTQTYYVGINPPTGDYDLLDNQPTIDGVPLTKNTTKADLDLDKVFQYRGQVATYDDLPTKKLTTGDTYNVADTGENYAWNGSGWDLLTGSEAIYYRNNVLESQGQPVIIDSDENEIINLTIDDITDITSTASEINQLHESQVVKADLTKLHNVSADASELNILDGATLTTTELNYVDGVTSSIQTQINNEISARTNADNTLQDNIDTEASTRATADTTLDGKIDDEISRATTAEGVLQDNIDAEVSRATDAELDLNDKIESEATARETADTTLDGKIDIVSSNLTQEISDRTDADSVLDGRLDVLEAKDYVLYTDISTQDNPNRKAIILNNHDGIFGKDTSGNTRLLAMLSKYNVADYGTTATHTNLNTQRIVTVNDNQAVLTDKILNQIILEGNKIDITEATVTDPTTGFQFKTYTIGADLADYYTKSEVDGKLTAAMHFKGTVATADDLPDENHQVGDMYNVLDTGSNYAWDGTNWDKLSETIDLSPFTNHIANTNNPHEVTKAQVGLGNVDNTADLDKPISTATQEALSLKASNEELQTQVAALTKKINDLKLLIPQEVFDASTTRTAMNSSGKVTLCEDIDLGKLNIGAGIFASNDTSVNLNGHTIQSAPTGGRAMLLARGTAKYTFNGDGEFIDTADDSSAIWCASETSSITINNGTFISEAHTETIYCEKGTITINGGEFKTGAVDKTYLLNCKDANYQAGTAKIIVKGGKFWDFDPHNNTAEGPNTNFCAEGYTTVSEEIDGHTVYTVVKA